jgi:hypothetical protein
MNYIEIPLTPESQIFKCSIGGIKYKLSIIWRESHYFLDIFDDLGVSLALGLRLVDGADLLGQLKHLGIDGALLMTSTPTYENLGIDSKLVVANV